MTPKIKTRMLVAVFAVLIPGVWSLSGNREGNGGDHVRSTFIKMGKAVVHHLRTSDAGMAVTQKHQLNLDLLESGLDIEKISLVEGSLIDNGGSEVDATGEPGKITLRKDQWYEHFERERDVYYLVFHELLRQAGVNDDNYVISADVRPFPSQDRVITRIASVLPLITVDDIVPFLSLNASDIVLNGEGCHPEDVFMDLDTEQGVLDISFEKYRALGTTDRTACDLRLPVKMNTLRRLVISQIDLSGRLRLPQGSSTAIALRPNLGTTIGTTVKKVITTAEYGRFKVRTNPTFSTACEDRSSLLGLNTNVQLVSPSSDAAVTVDRLSIYFRVESCVAGGETAVKRYY